jgi:DNA-binding NtrC family response regulator
MLRKHPEIDLLFTDVVLTGGMNGRQLADEAIKLRPGLKVLFTTGYTQNAIVHHGRLDEGINFIGKPFSASSLIAKVQSVLRG